MDMQQSETPRAPRRLWPFFMVGILLFVLGPAIYVLQIRLKQLDVMPWYVPGMASAGVVCLAISFWQRRGLLRTIALVLFTVVCGFEWYFALVLARTPDYTGPGQVNSKVPAFTTTLANGKPFTDHDLESGTTTVLLFYRGRW